MIQYRLQDKRRDVPDAGSACYTESDRDDKRKTSS